MTFDLYKTSSEKFVLAAPLRAFHWENTMSPP